MSKKSITILAFLWTAIILVLVGIPGNQIPKVSDWMDVFQPDKIIHVFIFAPFSWLWSKHFMLRTNSKKKGIIISAVFGILYAISTEIMQFYVFIGRNGNLADAIADIIGVLVGLVIFYKWTGIKT